VNKAVVNTSGSSHRTLLHHVPAYCQHLPVKQDLLKLLLVLLGGSNLFCAAQTLHMHYYPKTELTPEIPY